MTTQELRTLDKQHVWHPFTPMSLWLDDEPLVITAGDGFHLIDSDGNRYLDGVSSLWCNVHGHRVSEIDAAIRAQLDRIAHSTLLGLANEPSILLAEKLTKLVPPNLTKVFYSDAGATATEIAFKLAVQYWFNTGKPEKRHLISRLGSYHGSTYLAMSLTGRESDVLKASADGATVADIAAKLHLSESTVRNYLSAAIGKTGTRNRMEAMREARSQGWL